MTKQEKITNWLIEQGYPCSCGSLRVLVGSKICMQDFFSSSACGVLKYLDNQKGREKIYGIFDLKTGQYIPCPDFEDDKEAPVDKALQECIEVSSIQYAAALQEINERLKRLEARDD